MVLIVTDLARSLAFYRDVLGLEVDRRRDDLRMIHMRAGSSLVDLQEVDARIGPHDDGSESIVMHNLDHLCLKIADFDAEAACAELIGLGISVSEIDIRYGASGHGQSVYLQDPDGNGLELRG
ncbi:MAG: VOC family protein [Sphingomicrobium sp.]